MNKGSKCQVSMQAPFHGGTIAYFQFNGEAKNKDTVVLSLSKKPLSKYEGLVMIAVDKKHVTQIEA